MSSEVEANPEEDVREAKRPMVKIKKSLRSHIELGLCVGKILELFLCIVCMCLIYEPIQVVGLGKTHLHHVGIVYTAFTGYMVINGVTLVSWAIGERMPYKTSFLFAAMGSALFLVTGILLTMDRSLLSKQFSFPPQGHLLVMLTISILFVFVNVIIFAADAVFSFVMHMSYIGAE